MKDVSIELIVFGVLILVIVLDLLIKGRKKKQDIQDESNLIKGKETTDAKKSSFIKRFFKYLIERPKNITLYLVTVLTIKLLLTSTILSDYGYQLLLEGANHLDIDTWSILKTKPSKIFLDITSNIPIYRFHFNHHIQFFFKYKIEAFIYSLVIVSFLTWQFNSYLKKR